MMMTGTLEVNNLDAEDTTWQTAKKIVEEAVPWADQVIITAVTQPLVEMTLLPSPTNEERVMHKPQGPMQIHFVATGVHGW